MLDQAVQTVRTQFRSTQANPPPSSNKPPPPIQQKSNFIPQSMTLRGGLIGAAITLFLSWNSGRYSKIGVFLKRWRFIRYFSIIKEISGLPSLTNYHYPPLDTVANNFFCYSGEPGIGKSHHFQAMVAKESTIRPALYVSFKSMGREVNFEADLAEQLNYGEDASGMIAELIRAIKKIHLINQSPRKFTMQYLLTHFLFFGTYYLIYVSEFSTMVKLVAPSILFCCQSYYTYFMGPLIEQSMRRTLPLIVFDDLNKIENMNMLPEIVRFLKLIEDKAGNIMLVSSDEETWSKLRRQPGMKDRLRVKQIKYDHIQTANRLIQAADNDFPKLASILSVNKLFDKTIVKLLVREFIGVRQMSLRRFISVLKLTDEEEYQKFVQILSKKDSVASNTVNEFIKTLLESEAQTMVTNIKIIKRECKDMSEKQFIDNLELLLRKFKLPPDNKLGGHLKVYNIVRDLKSEYVINGKFTFIIYQLAVKEYIEDIKEYQMFGEPIPATPPNAATPNSSVPSNASTPPPPPQN